MQISKTTKHTFDKSNKEIILFFFCESPYWLRKDTSLLFAYIYYLSEIMLIRLLIVLDNSNTNNNVTCIAQVRQGRKCATTCQCQTGMFSVDFLYSDMLSIKKSNTIKIAFLCNTYKRSFHFYHFLRF